jgi:hypothetical protein
LQLCILSLHTVQLHQLPVPIVGVADGVVASTAGVMKHSELF